MSIEWAIKPEDIEWEMDWGPNPPTGKPAKEMMFEREKALAHLFLNEVIYTSSHWWKHFKLGDRKEGGGYHSVPREDAEWSAEDSEIISINVNCNDVFAWGCADSEALPHREIENLYRMWVKDPLWGPAVWCMIQRRQMPQKPVGDRIRAAGIWDLDSLGLGTNTQDAEVQAMFAALKR